MIDCQTQSTPTQVLKHSTTSDDLTACGCCVAMLDSLRPENWLVSKQINAPVLKQGSYNLYQSKKRMRKTLHRQTQIWFEDWMRPEPPIQFVLKLGHLCTCFKTKIIGWGSERDPCRNFACTNKRFSHFFLTLVQILSGTRVALLEPCGAVCLWRPSSPCSLFWRCIIKYDSKT